MVDCKICENGYCKYAKTDRGFVAACSGYIEPKKPQTLADHIRAMSDEGLVDWVMRFMKAAIVAGGVEATDIEFAPNFADGFLELLRQPVKDGDNE